MKKTLITATLLFVLSPIAAFAQSQSQPQANASNDVAAQMTSQGIPTYEATDLALAGGN